MLRIFEDLFKDLRKENISFCNWKGYGDLKNQLAGSGDLDIFVHLDDKKKFEEISKCRGFSHVVSYQANHSFLEHYYGFDSKSQKFAHMHVYFKIVTGEHISKNYILPLDNYLMRNIDFNSLLPSLSENAKLNILLIRYFLKIGTLLGILQYKSVEKKTSLDWNLIQIKQIKNGLPELGLSEKALNEMLRAYKNLSFFWKIYYSIMLKKKLRNYRRRSFLKNFIFTFKSISLRILNKVFFKKKKLLNQGFVVAICGLDASGKSSLVNSLKNNFSRNFSVRTFHLGKPSSSLLTFMINPFVFLFRRLNRQLKNSNKSFKNSEAKYLSILNIFRALLLAYDRKKNSNRAHKLANIGFIVICDRYPGIEEGKMDSPRIIASKTRGFFYQLCYNIENKIYNSIKPAHLIYQLLVPLEISIERNKKRIKIDKETDNELKERFKLNEDVAFLSESHIHIDATLSTQKVLAQVSESIWQFNIEK